ncbi:sugar ABC transporter substrate-binding protein [Microbacterium sp. Leaf159]|uniref:sugar ABC transporter substrate-binding protein n=1 Tax=Microbacterium sp. Leaf159 TaxID=1736279 RepID=UPI000AB23B7A|nr:substrate-binding domain-containing protein [Microbacterium sp. Leaf159]
MKHKNMRLITLSLGAVAALVLSGCSATNDSGDEALTIAFLMPESNTTRYEAFDKPLFEAAIEELAPGSKVLYSNANGDPTLQQSQLESVLAQGPDVVVLNAADSVQGEGLVDTANSAGVPVISYDRLIDNENVGYYVSFDNPQVGVLQAQTLVDHLTEQGVTTGDLLMVNGAPTDPNAAQYKEGAHKVIDGTDFTIVGEFDTPNWAAADAQQWVEGQLGTIDRDSLIGVYAGNDSTASGVVAALIGAGISPVPPVTGQDAELEAVQRIVAGTQYMTVYKSIKQQATDAAEAAVALARGDEPKSSSETNGIPTTLLTPVALTAENISDTVIADGVYTAEEICTAELTSACAELALK